MRRRPVMAWRSVSRGVHRHSIELRNHCSGVPTLYNDGEGNMNWCDKASAGLAIQFTSLFHHITVDQLRESYRKLNVYGTHILD